MKGWAVFGILAATCTACAQIPELIVHLDITGSFRSEPNNPNLFQFYDVMGRPSIVSLSFYTPQQFRVYVAEKLEHLPGDATGDPFDQYFVEDEGIWRLGKQYMPFGSGRILHESALAVRGDTNQILEGIPIAMAYCDAGTGYDSGIVGRIGSMIGLSCAVGRHFGIAATSLDDIRHPEDAPGEGRGWREAIGVDASRRLSKWTVRGEAVSFQQGETALDPDITVLEASGAYEFRPGTSGSFTVTQEAPSQQYFYRFAGEMRFINRVTFEPSIRFRNGSLFDVAAEVRVRF